MKQTPVKVNQSNGKKVDKEKKHMKAIADCKNADCKGFWISSCETTCEEFGRRMNQLPSNDAKQRLLIMQGLQSSLSKILSVNELTDAIGIHLFDKAFIFRQHLKRSFLIGKNALPVFIKDPPKQQYLQLRRN